MAALVGMDYWRYVTANTVEERLINLAVLERAVELREVEMKAHASMIVERIVRAFSGG